MFATDLGAGFLEVADNLLQAVHELLKVVAGALFANLKVVVLDDLELDLDGPDGVPSIPGDDVLVLQTGIAATEVSVFEATHLSV
jgi:hypothetical protein